MVFKIYSFSGAGVKAEGDYYSHIQAFRIALELSKNKLLTYIIERQWSVAKMTLIDKNYLVKNRSIYNTDDMSIPIYSQLDKFIEYDRYRNLMYCMIKNIQDIYAYMKVKCPYSDEYMYSYTYAELRTIESNIASDNVVIDFYQVARKYLDSALEIITSNNMPTDMYINDIVHLPPVEMMNRLKGFHKSIKNHLLKNMYGASLIEMYPL